MPLNSPLSRPDIFRLGKLWLPGPDPRYSGQMKGILITDKLAGRDWPPLWGGTGPLGEALRVGRESDQTLDNLCVGW